MTKYAADDFRTVRFADFDHSNAIAMRSGSGRKPWVIPNGRILSDAKMAADGWVPVREKPRTLTPDDITDEMVERVQQWAVGLRAGGTVYLGTKRAVCEMFDVALTEPPARPERAEEIETLIDEWNTDDAGDFADLADYLAARLTDPTRPTGAEKVEAVLHQYWSGDINGDDLADRIAEEMNR